MCVRLPFSAGTKRKFLDDKVAFHGQRAARMKLLCGGGVSDMSRLRNNQGTDLSACLKNAVAAGQKKNRRGNQSTPVLFSLK